MAVRQDSSGRVQPVEYRNLIEPATCALCGRIGRYPEEIFASLGVELEHYGMVYLCLECCAELADFICFKSPEAYDKLLDTSISLAHDYDEAKAQLERAVGLLHARIDFIVVSGPNSDGATSLPFSEVERESDSLDSTIDPG